MPTLSRQNELLQYGVPKLEDTLSKFQESVRPFLTENELDVNEKLIEAFLAYEGNGRKLHQLLEVKARNSDNWVRKFVPYFLIY